MKYSDMNQYITLLFSLLAEFFSATQNPFRARSAGDRPPRSFTCPRDCSSGGPDPERCMARKTPSGPVARGPVPRDRPTRAKNARQPKPFSRSRHGEGQALALR